MRNRRSRSTRFNRAGNMSLPTRGDLHLKRKFFHAAFGCLFAYWRAIDPSITFIVALFAVVLIVCVGEFFRLNVPSFNTFQRAIFGSVMREHEQTQISGIVFYLSGVLFSSVFFNPTITVLASLVLGFADPAASACGIISGQQKFSGNKTLAGFCGFVFVSSIVLVTAHALLFDVFSWPVVKGCVVASIIGGIAELFSGRDNVTGVDDNFVIPVVVSIALLAVSPMTAMNFDRFTDGLHIIN